MGLLLQHTLRKSSPTFWIFLSLINKCELCAGPRCLTESHHLCGVNHPGISAGDPLSRHHGPCSEYCEVKSLSRVQLFATPWTVAHQAPLSMGFSRQEYWSGVPFPSPGDLPNTGTEPRSPALQANSLPAEPQGKPSFKAPPSCKEG